jgi:hypothetical protein
VPPRFGRGMFGRNVGWIHPLQILRDVVPILAAIILLLLPSAASATVPHSTRTLVAPFKGSYSLIKDTYVNGCSRTKTITPSFIRFHNGAIGWDGMASTKSCGGAGWNTAEDAGGFYPATIRIPSSAGATSIYVNATYLENASLAMTNGTCKAPGRPSSAYCNPSAEVNVQGFAELVDTTTGAVKYASTYLYLFNESVNESYWGGSKWTYSGSWSGSPISLTGTYSWRITPTVSLAKGNNYYLDLVVRTFSIAECIDQYAIESGCSATASMNFSMTLTSIVET